MIRKLFKLVAVLLVLLIIGVVVAVVYIDQIAQRAVVEGSTYALGVPTSLDKADVKILAGEFAMSGLKVSNPQGYATPHFLAMKDGDVAVRLTSLREDVVELPKLELSGLDMYMEKKQGKANYEVILDNLKKLESGQTPEPAPESKKFVIREVAIRDVTVHVEVLPLGGDLTKTAVPIEEIVLKDVGSGGKPVDMAYLTDVVIKAVFAATLSKAGQLPGDLANELGNGLKGLGDVGQFGIEVGGKTIETVGEAAGEILKGAEKTGEDVTKGVGEVLKGVGGILGGKKEEEKK